MAYTLTDQFRPLRLVMRLNGIVLGLALGLALTPMSGIAFVLTADFMSNFPQAGARVGEIALASLCILEIVGPVVLQRVLIWTGEGQSTADRSGGQP